MAKKLDHKDGKGWDARKTVTEANDPELGTNRNKIRAKFMDTEKLQGSEYARNLEKNLQINKEILNELISSDTRMEDGCKKTLIKLNTEAMSLQTQIKKLVKERNDLQAKLLINEQLIDNLSMKQNELISDCNEKVRTFERAWQDRVSELEEELEYKGCELQTLQLKFSKAETLLRKHSGKSAELEAACQELFKQSTTRKKLTSVVFENEALTKEIEALKKKLEAKHAQEEAESANEKLTRSPQLSRSFVVRSSIPSLDLSKVKKPDNPEADTAYIHKLEESIKLLNVRIKTMEDSIREISQKNMQLENTNSNLFQMNVSMSKALQEEKEKLEKVSGRGSRTRTQNNKSWYATGTMADLSEPKNAKLVPITKSIADQPIKIKENAEKEVSFCEEGGVVNDD